VLDGRDIGSVIFPDAEVKLYVTASLEARAERRWQELRARGVEADRAEVAGEMAARDARDAARDAAPMRAAADAVVLNTTGLDADGAFGAALAVVRGLLGGLSAVGGTGLDSPQRH
jgi:cytidylate kinase